MRILFTGGGTGGHIFPIIAIKEAFEKPCPFYYLGPDSFAKKHLQGFKVKFISAGKLRRYFDLRGPFDFLKVLIGVFQSLWQLFLWMPDVIFSKGGYGSFPVVLAGWIYRIPIILHESDSVPGLANRIMAKFAKKIIISFPDSEKYFVKNKKSANEKLILIGNPIRRELLEGNREEGKKIFKISSNKPVILILGGSQGAQKINEIVINTLPRLLEIAEVIHVSGKRNFKANQNLLDSISNKQEYHLYPFLEAKELKQAYAVADLIVNRAGAGSIFEIAALGKPSILIPLPNAAAEHQKKNAFEFSGPSPEDTDKGRTVVLTQENLIPDLFLDKISDLLSHPDKLKNMGQEAKTFYNPKTP